MLIPREKKRYGKFSVNSLEVGKCVLEISIEGFFDDYKVYKNGKLIAYGTSDEEDENFVKENDEKIIFQGMCPNPIITVKKPFGKCLKRF